MRHHPVILLSAFVLLLGGCVSAPDNHPREQALNTEHLGLGEDGAPSASASWWKAFNDPQFNALLERARANNPTLSEALARMRGAEAELAQSRAQYYPQLNIDIDEQRQRFSENYIIPPPFGGRTDWIGTAQAKLSWSIDFWGKQAALISGAHARHEAGRLEAEAARLAVTGALAEAYIDLDKAYALADIARLAEKQRQQIVDLAARRANAGLDSKEQLREAEVLLGQARVARVQAEAAQQMAIHLLAALTGQGAKAYRTIKRPQIRLDALLPLPEQLPADLLTRRPDIIAARWRIEAALSARDAARAAYYPSIDLTAFAGFSAIGLGDLLTAPSRVFGGGPVIHLPIFDAGRLDAVYENRNADIDAAIASYNGIVLNAVRQAADRLTGISSLDIQLTEQNHTLSAAEDGARIASSRYRAGLTTYLAVLYAETALYEARKQKAALAAAQASNRIRLLLAVGGDFIPANTEIASATQAMHVIQDKSHE